MRLIQFECGGKQRIGFEVEEDGDVVSLGDESDEFPCSMVDFLAGGEKMLKAAARCSETADQTIKREDITLLPPLTKPSKIVCVGMNYRDHCAESSTPIPLEPVIFGKFPSAIIGHGESILIPKLSSTIDWEAELAVVIGKSGRNIQVDEAMDHVAGFTIANDVTARDWYRKRNGGQVILGKTFDTFCPIGPVILTKNALPNPHNLRIRCLVNNEVMQDSSTDQLIFKTEECISWISKFCTLEPGDLVLTGTPPGSGTWRSPPVYLKVGDIVTCEIEKIGKLINSVACET